MGHMYQKIANNAVIEDYVVSPNMQILLSEFSSSDDIKRVIGDDFNFAYDTLEDGVYAGIKTYLHNLSHSNSNPSLPEVINHLKDTESFSETIYRMMTLHPSISDAPAMDIYRTTDDDSSPSVYLTGTTNALIQISKLSEIVAKDFNEYINRIYIDNLRSKRIF
jgi:hypothetical protein